MNALAGLGAGMTEAIFAVTPSETIKCVFCLLSRTILNLWPQNEAHRRRQEPEPEIPRLDPWHVYYRQGRGYSGHISRSLPCGAYITTTSPLGTEYSRLVDDAPR